MCTGVLKRREPLEQGLRVDTRHKARRAVAVVGGIDLARRALQQQPEVIALVIVTFMKR